MGLKDNIKNGMLSAGCVIGGAQNSPAQYADRQRRYFEGESVRFASEMARYASDYFAGEAQGLFADAPTEWTPIQLRMADVGRPSAAIQRRFDDHKNVFIASPPIDYLRPGTKIRAMGSVWLAVNPQNISSPVGNGIIRRCNSVWNYLDWYGNVCSEPIIVEELRANSSASEHQESGLITKGYFNVIAQFNDATRQLDTNSRLILGTGGYRVTGYSDFQMEFTGEYDSVRLLEFTIRYEEPNTAIDDMENHVAGGKTFSWALETQKEIELAPGGQGQILVTSRRNGQETISTGEHPFSYVFSSSDADIADVDAAGVISGKTPGACSVVVSLAENPNIRAEISVVVAEGQSGPYVAFTKQPPATLPVYESCSIEAGYFDGGTLTGETVSWSFGGAQPSAYSVKTEGNKAVISCWSGSIAPLKVTAEYAGQTVTAEIVLEGI